jgi:FHS family glucose/mannose:H+ symporter-like MFS transporter
MSISKIINNRVPIHWVTAIFVGIFLYGFSENMRGSLLPSILADLNLSYGFGGMILAANPLGFICTPWLAGRLLPTLGFKKLYLTSSLLLILGFTLFGLTQQIELLFLGQFLTGLGLGALQLLTNSSLILMWPKQKGRLLSFGAIAFSLGASYSPIFATQFVSQNEKWPVAFLFASVVAVIFGAPFLIGKSTALLEVPKPIKKQAVHLHKGFKRFSIIFACYAIIEIGFSVWIAEFLQVHYGLSSSLSRHFLSLYFISLLCGRLLGSLYLDKLGYKKSALIHLVAYTSFLSILLFTQANSMLMILIGLSASVFFPIMTALASDHFKEKTQEALGYFYSVAGIGGIIALWGIGKLSEIITLNNALLLIAFSSITMILFIGSIKIEKSN